MPVPEFPFSAWLLGLAAATISMLALWLRQLRSRDATSVDVAWAGSIGALALAFAANGDGALVQRLLAAGMAAVWSGRLCLHLVRDRMAADRGEDPRYAALRAHLGDRAPLGFLAVYLAQALLVVLFATPFLVLAQLRSESLSALQWAGLALAAAGLLLEASADAILASHRRDPTNRGRTCRAGPWRWSRHPNYFGEWLVWCGIAAVAVPAPHGSTALLAPVLMFVMVRFVSGVPFAERQARKSRGDDYGRYSAATNAFFPWWPRRERGEAT